MSPPISEDIRATNAALLQRERVNEFLAVARSILTCRALNMSAPEYVARSRLTARVGELVKAGIPGPGPGGPPLFQPMASAFLQSLQSISVLDRLLALGAVSAPTNTLAISVTTLVSGASPAEAAPKPASAM